jgi:protein-disulfide isomerase
MSDEPTIDKSEESISESIKTEEKITIKKSTYKNMIKGVVVAIAIAAFFGGYAVGTLDQGNNLTQESLEKMLTEIARSNANPQPAQAPQPNAPKIVKVSLDDDPVKGNPDAEVTIVEFSDFQCPFCSRFYDQTLPLIQKNYIDTGKIKFVYRDFPIDSLHPNARPAHVAAECADEQGKFWDYHDILFERVDEWQRLPMTSLGDKFVSFADELELEQSSFISCLESQTIAQEVQADYLDGGRYGVTGTPAFFVGTEKDGYILISGAQPFTSFQTTIDSLLN